MGQPSPAVQGDTFLRAKRSSISEVGAGDTAVIGIPHELTKISRPGTSYGPRAIRQATLMTDFVADQYARPDLGRGLVDVDAERAYRYRPNGLHDVGDVVTGPDLDENRRRIEEPIREIAKVGALPVVLGGDHFISHPVYTGVASANDAPLALLSLDMHMDLADEAPEFGRYNGGTWLRRLIEEEKVDPKATVIFGVESLLIREEWEFAQSAGVTVITAQRVFREGVEETLRPALESALEGCDGLYVTLDIDAGARSLVPGTGNQGGAIGLTPQHLLEVSGMLDSMPLKGLDLSELSPPLDPSGATAGLAAGMLLSALHSRLFEEVDFPDGVSA